jgi:hypothetical protein
MVSVVDVSIDVAECSRRGDRQVRRVEGGGKFLSVKQGPACGWLEPRATSCIRLTRLIYSNTKV